MFGIRRRLRFARDQVVDLMPSWRSFRTGGADFSDVVVLSVYRRRNAERTESLVRPVREAGGRIALWALDETAPALAEHTLGVGSAARSVLLNRLWGAVDGSTAHRVLIVDDDVVCSRPLTSFVVAADAAGLQLAQPAHARRGSYYSHEFNRRRGFAIARQTATIEVGPIVYVRPPWTSAILPLPENAAMGWGVDLLWSGLSERGCTIGVVDAVWMQHLAPVALEYDKEAEVDAAASMLGRPFLPGEPVYDMPTVATWRPWRRRPEWQRVDALAASTFT